MLRKEIKEIPRNPYMQCEVYVNMRIELLQVLQVKTGPYRQRRIYRCKISRKHLSVLCPVKP